VTISCSYFQTLVTTSVKLTKTGESDINGTSVTVVNDTTITCNFDLTGAAAGAWNVVVTNPDAQSGTLPNGFTVETVPPPTITSITPSSGVNTGTVQITNLAGSNFQTTGTTTVKLTKSGQADVNATDVTVVSSSQITCEFDLRTAIATGPWNVVVTNPDSQSGQLSDGFTVNAPPTAPTITSITPSSGVNTGTVHITDLAGTNFYTAGTANVAEVKLTRVGETDIVATNLTVLSTSITCDFDLTGAATGEWNVVVTNKQDESGMLPNGFTVESAGARVYLPLMVKNYPPFPGTPVLNAISDPEGDGNYTVSWSAAARAQTYVLEEDDNASFSSPTTAYSGSSTSASITGRATGTYYYRVKASNSWGDSGWSNVQSVTVQPPSGPTPGFWEGYGMEFYVTTDRAYVDNFAIYISVQGCGNYKIIHTPLESISNNQFSFGGSFYASGTFHSATSASGTTGLDNFYIQGCGTVSGGPFSWNATWQNSSQPAPVRLEAEKVVFVEPVVQSGDSYPVPSSR